MPLKGAEQGGSTLLACHFIGDEDATEGTEATTYPTENTEAATYPIETTEALECCTSATSVGGKQQKSPGVAHPVLREVGALLGYCAVVDLVVSSCNCQVGFQCEAVRVSDTVYCTCRPCPFSLACTQHPGGHLMHVKAVHDAVMILSSRTCCLTTLQGASGITPRVIQQRSLLVIKAVLAAPLIARQLIPSYSAVCRIWR